MQLSASLFVIFYPMAGRQPRAGLALHYHYHIDSHRITAILTMLVLRSNSSDQHCM